ncbi:hypothetical protein OS493_037103 [Desmophyllum pertusum]|uniref:Uncharacterized protein n=1 Tax=Desmophyllum pertusum TaxID=174260 RepID=A0A9W9YI35_9CNID|nr:hypothetical protein OS493_037103 [Desmophyllum pertusum]
MEGQISNCKATQTDFNVPQSAANEGFSSSDEISYERNGDMPVDAETMVVAFSPQTCEVAIITECNAGASSNI